MDENYVPLVLSLIKLKVLVYPTIKPVLLCLAKAEACNFTTFRFSLITSNTIKPPPYSFPIESRGFWVEYIQCMPMSKYLRSKQ